MALVSLSHGHTGAVPVPILGFLLLVIIESARAEGCTEGDLVLRKTFDHDRGNGLVDAEFGARIFKILVCECCHGLGGLFQGNGSFFFGHAQILAFE